MVLFTLPLLSPYLFPIPPHVWIYTLSLHDALPIYRVYMRSLATRDSRDELSKAIQEVIDVVRASGYDFIIVETSGIGQGDAAITEITDLSMYVMTAEFGAPTQLEKIGRAHV